MHGFWESIGRDLTGQGLFGGSFQFRLVLQPLIAVILGIRFGIRDAKSGDPPFFQSLARGKGQRGNLLLKAARDVVLPLLVGVSRVYLDAHWATDVLGGWSAGLFIAALSAGVYNRARRGRRAERGVGTRTPSAS